MPPSAIRGRMETAAPTLFLAGGAGTAAYGEATSDAFFLIVGVLGAVLGVAASGMLVLRTREDQRRVHLAYAARAEVVAHTRGRKEADKLVKPRRHGAFLASLVAMAASVGGVVLVVRAWLGVGGSYIGGGVLLTVAACAVTSMVMDAWFEARYLNEVLDAPDAATPLGA